MTFENKTGLNVLASYGPRSTGGKFGAVISQDGVVKQAVWDFTYNDLPDGSSTDSLGISHIIPANSTILSAKLIVDTAFASTSKRRPQRHPCR